jgi:3-isopropylmalate dehydrogenase
MSARTYRIAVLRGDGIGPEVVDAAITVLDRAGPRFGVAFDYQEIDAGAGRYQRTGESISAEDMDAIGSMDAVLLGAMGLPDVRKPDGTEVAPQIDLREHYGLFGGLRPAKLYKGVPGPLRTESIDLLLIRESTEGMFAGRHDKVEPSDTSVSDRMTITRATCEKLFALAFQQARLRRARGTPGHVTLVDKANVLRSNAFMRKIFDEVAARNPDIPTDRLYVDAASMLFVTQPQRFDVVVTENLFGDITSEIAAGVIGGLGVAPSADLSETHGVFQPSHGTAPDIAGKGIANPVATILSAAMMLDWLGHRHGDPACLNAADAVNKATARVLETGPRTRDIGGLATTVEVTTAIVAALA